MSKITYAIAFSLFSFLSVKNNRYIVVCVANKSSRRTGKFTVEIKSGTGVTISIVIPFFLTSREKTDRGT